MNKAFSKKLGRVILAVGTTVLVLPFGVLAEVGRVIGWFTSPYYHPGRDRR